MQVSALDFIRRFLQHSLPDGFHRIRHYGFLANSQRVGKLKIARRLLGARTPESLSPAKTVAERVERLTGLALDVCPSCGGHIVRLSATPALKRTHPPRGWDSS